jgi:hypothetical protein
MRTFQTFRQTHQPQIQVEIFDEIVAAMRGDCLKKGDEWHTAGFVQILCSPNEDFRKPENISHRRFEHFFKGFRLNFGDGYLKSAQNDGPKCFPVFENLRLGSIKFGVSCRRLNVTQ